MTWSDDLEGPHLAIAGSKSQRVGVLAGPGTGKTSYGLMRRIARLLEEGSDPRSVLLVSFTRTAAHDLREKAAGLVAEGAEGIAATTLHAYCFGLLQREAVLQVTQRMPRPLLDHERDVMLRDLNGNFGDIFARRDLLAAYEAGWVRGDEDHPGLATSPVEHDFQNQVLGWLRHHQAMLIGEVVPITHAYLRATPLSDELQRFDHIVIDEYQDLNWLEQSMIDVLADRPEVDLCVAGDDDQSIYGFRHANPEGIRRFLNREEVEEHSITTCGRCPRSVLDMANTLISHSPGRAKAPLSAVQDDEGAVSIVQWSDVEEEVEGLAAAIAEDLQARGREPGDILVLVHRRKIGNALRSRLRELEIPAHSFFTEDLAASEAAQRGLATLQFAVNDDRVALRVLLGLGDADRRSGAYQRLQAYSRSAGQHPREVLQQLADGASLKLRVRALVGHFTDALAEAATLPEEPSEAVDKLFPADIAEVAELRGVALALAEDCATNAELLDGLVAAITQIDVPPHPDYVRIMSLHKSKGLTSPVVYLAAMVDGVVPTLKTNQSDEAYERAVEEQRRLTYVAITRAAQELTISYSSWMNLAFARSQGVHVVQDKIRRRNGEPWAPTIPSRYLNELGPAAPRPVAGTVWLGQRSS